MTDPLILKWILASLLSAGLFLAWFIRLTDNHYQRGFRDGFNRARAMERQGDSQ